MNYYPQYIHVPTAVPVQRYFADPHVPINRYDAGDFINKVESGVNTIGGKLNGFLGKTGTLGNVFGGNKLSPSAGGIVSGIGSAIGQGAFKLGTGNFDRGTGAGTAINGVGNFVGGLVGKVNPLLGGIVKAGAGIIGGLANRITGYHLNDATIGAINSDISSMNNTRVTDSSNQSIANQAMAQNWGGSFGLRDIGSWGWASKGKVQNQYNKLQRGMASGQNYMAANYANAADNVTSNTMNNLLINSSAGGGILDRSFSNPWDHPGSGAIAYGMDQAALANQRQMINQMQPQNFGIPMQPQQYGCGGCKPHCFGGRLFAEGGSMNTHGSDFTNGLMYITEGGRHEENPYQGVPMGYDQQGTPNVVEEGEIIIPGRMLADGGEMSDYVVSNRTTISEELADKYQLPYDTTHAEALEILTEESQENPTDIIAQNTDKAIAREVYADQEKVKQQEQQRQAMMQQMMQQQAAPEQMMMAQQDQMEGPAMDKLMAQQAQQEGIPMQPQMSAFGGNLFGCGGKKCHAFGGGLFGPVNMFEGEFSPSTITRNAYNKAYTPAQVYEGMQFSNAWLAALEDMRKAGMTDEQIAETFNTWQDKYDYMISHPDDKAAIRDLQEYVDKNFSRFNGAFNADHLFNEYYNPETVSKGPDSPHTTGDNPWVDGILEGMTYQRHGGRSDMSNDLLNDLQYKIAQFFGGNGDYYLPEGKNTYRIQLKEPKYLTDLSNDDPNAEGEVYTPSGAGSNPEQTDDDRYEGETPAMAKWRRLPTWGRNLPIWAAGLGVLGDTLGITNRPDYDMSNRLASLAKSSNGFMPVSYHPNGEQMVYKPYDPVLQNIMNQADVAAAHRGIIDNNGPATNAALLALNRNAMKANGELGLAARQYNDQLLNNTLQFNNIVNAQNSQGIFGADAQNAANWARQQNMFASMMGESIAARQAAKDKADAARAMNLNNFLKGVSGKHKENFYFNTVNENPAYGGYQRDPRSGGFAYNGVQAGIPYGTWLGNTPFFGWPI